MAKKPSISISTKPPSTKLKQVPESFQAGFLNALDGRTELARILRDNYKSIVEDIGGVSEVGKIKSSLVERFVWLEAVLQTIEHDMATDKIGRTEAIGRWIQAVNALTGLAKALGIERKSPEPMDLSAYVIEATSKRSEL